MVLLLVFMQLTRDLFAIAKFLLISLKQKLHKLMSQLQHSHNSCALQITMTTGRLLLLLLLLLLVVASSHSVDSQSTTDDELCDGGQNSKLQQHVDMLMSIQQQILQQHQQFSQQLQSVVNRLGT